MANKKTLGILFGGNSTEYEVSLLSASSVIQNVDRELFDPVLIGITREGKWFHYYGDEALIASGAWVDSSDKTAAFISPDPTVHGLVVGGGENIYLDVVFPVLHGKNGEDGTMQGLLTLSNIPFVGCRTASSAICMDKDLTHIVLTHHGIPNAAWVTVYRYQMAVFDDIAEAMEAKLGYPMFVKPANAGSSVGVSKAKDRASLKAALELAHTVDEKAVVEECIIGREVECAVMGNLNPTASVLGEIEPCNEFYDYEAKYQADSGAYIPARLDEATTRLVQETAVKAYRALECRGMTRVDFFVCEDGSILLNEPNTLPGFTAISMYPKLRQQDGTSYRDVITQLVMFAMESDV